MKSVDLLVFRLASEGVKSVCSEVTLVAYLTNVYNVKTILCIPVSVLLGSKLNACEHAKGICCLGIDSLGLVDPVKSKSKSICCLIKYCIGECEVLVTNLKLCDVNIEVVIEINSCSNLGKHAYTLCKLKKEVPCGCIFHIRAGQHVGKIRELRRNRDLGHVQSEYVGCGHLIVDIDRCIGNIVYGSRIAYLAEPSELTITAGCKIKVEAVLALLEEIKCH